MAAPKLSEVKRTHRAPQFRHADDMSWETLRFPGQLSKMLFHPHPDAPSEPNAGLVRYEPGASHPLHTHQFAQVWYILEGTFRIGEQEHGPGTMFYYADPHYEEALSTETGGTMVFVQYQGPSTGEGPIYDGRFNVSERPDLSTENLDT